LTQSDMDTGSDTSQVTRDYCRNLGDPNDDAGHIIANRLGGSGRDPINIFP
jgi:hypothetical protein